MRSANLDRFRVGSLAAAAVACLAVAGPRPAVAEPVFHATVQGGVDLDATSIGRLQAGGLFDLGRFAPELHLGFDTYNRLNSDRGISAPFGVSFDAGVRYAFLDERFRGPYVAAGGSYGLFLRKPRERIVADAETCQTAPGSPDRCTYDVNKNATVRLGFGWGFASGDSSTVAVRLDVSYWAFSLRDFENQPASAPIPREVPRPQDTFTVMVGLEFLRWM